MLVSGFSRVITARMLPTRQSPDLLAGHWELLRGWGRLPKTLVWDNESAVGRWRAGRPELTRSMNEFRGTLGIGVRLCAPRDPESKGMVERANGYLETSFLPGRAFTGPADFNGQLTGWLDLANRRVHRRLGCRPVDRWAQDLAAMLTLPPVPPVVGWQESLLLPRDHYVRVDSNDYSVDPQVVGRRVQVDRRPGAGGGDLRRERRRRSRPVLGPPADHLRSRPRRGGRGVAGCAAGPARLPVDTQVADRDLADYDRIFGLDTDGEVA